MHNRKKLLFKPLSIFLSERKNYWQILLTLILTKEFLKKSKFLVEWALGSLELFEGAFTHNFKQQSYCTVNIFQSPAQQKATDWKLESQMTKSVCEKKIVKHFSLYLIFYSWQPHYLDKGIKNRGGWKYTTNGN